MVNNLSDNGLCNNFYNIGLGALNGTGAVIIGSQIYKNPMKFSAFIFNNQEFLSLMALCIYEIASELFSKNNQEIKRDLAIAIASTITVLSLAYGASFGYRIPSYLLIATSASIVAGVALVAVKSFYKGFYGLFNNLFGQKAEKGVDNLVVV